MPSFTPNLLQCEAHAMEVDLAVLGRGGGRRAPQHSTATGPPKAQARPDPGQIRDIWEPGNPEVWNPIEPLRQRFQNFGPTGTLASKISRFPNHSGNPFHLRYWQLGWAPG